MNGRLQNSELFAALPPPWPEDPLPGIGAAMAESQRKLVVLDDDPTGTQTVYDIPVLTSWSVEDLHRELAGEAPGFYLLTNSRAFPPEEAVRINVEIAQNLRLAAEAVPEGGGFTVVSRSDSTLRGHFPVEVEALGCALSGHSEATGARKDLPPILLIPCFEAGGRYTINDIHYVAEGDELIPAAETAFARDAAFGYRHSNLREWVEEKTSGAAPATKVLSISLEEIRQGGPDAVAGRMRALNPGDICIVNAAVWRDLEVVALAALETERTGVRMLYRTAASFVAARLGLAPRPLWQPTVTGERSGGLVVVGSHVPSTSRQLEHLLKQAAIEAMELRVPELLGPEGDRILAHATAQVNSLLGAGRDVAVYTSRELVTGATAAESLGIGARVSSALVQIVRNLQARPRYFIAKGGITSSDLAAHGLGVKRAMVLGQILPGVPVWELGAETQFPGLTYVVFPGNVGGPDALMETVIKFKP